MGNPERVEQTICYTLSGFCSEGNIAFPGRCPGLVCGAPTGLRSTLRSPCKRPQASELDRPLTGRAETGREFSPTARCNARFAGGTIPGCVAGSAAAAFDTTNQAADLRRVASRCRTSEDTHQGPRTRHDTIVAIRTVGTGSGTGAALVLAARGIAAITVQPPCVAPRDDTATCGS